MSNMSYCRFQNTMLDLRDCVEALGEALDCGIETEEFTKDLGKDETYAYRRMFGLCKEFVDYYSSMERINEE